MKRGLTLGAEINSLGEKWTGWTALHHAADAGQVEVVKFLLDQGADLDRISLDYAAHTALHLAVSKRHYEVVSVLLAGGADPDLYTATGCCGTALHLASALADLRLCRDLLARGAQAGAVSEEGSSVLHYLSVSQTPEALEVVKLLLENGSDQLDINAVDWDGYTALMRSESERGQNY